MATKSNAADILMKINKATTNIQRGTLVPVTWIVDLSYGHFKVRESWMPESQVLSFLTSKKR